MGAEEKFNPGALSNGNFTSIRQRGALSDGAPRAVRVGSCRAHRSGFTSSTDPNDLTKNELPPCHQEQPRQARALLVAVSQPLTLVFYRPWPLFFLHSSNDTSVPLLQPAAAAMTRRGTSAPLWREPSVFWRDCDELLLPAFPFAHVALQIVIPCNRLGVRRAPRIAALHCAAHPRPWRARRPAMQDIACPVSQRSPPNLAIQGAISTQLSAELSLLKSQQGRRPRSSATSGEHVLAVISRDADIAWNVVRKGGSQ